MKYIFALLTVILAVNIGLGQHHSPLDSVMSIHVKNGFNGNVIYSRNDSIKFKGNYGFANTENQIPLTDTSIFDLASVSKQFTAVAVIQLIEKELLSYDTKLEEVWADFPYPGITIEHLLRHQSGLPDYIDFLSKSKFWNKQDIATNNDLINIMKAHELPLVFTPGTQSFYSNTGYAILASVIEQISGLTYGAYLHDNIFDPLQMRNSKVVRRIYRPDNDPNLTTGYYRKGKKNAPNYLYDKKMKYYDGIVGDGMVHSTILDLLKWKQALKNNTLISEVNKEKMFSGDEISSTYGFGFVIQNSDSLGKYVLHTGSWQGYHSFLLYILSSDEFVVVLSNNSYDETAGINNDLLKYGR